MIKVGSDFSGVGAFDQALQRLNIDYKTMFACDMDKYARETYVANYGEPDYYPTNVYNRKIPKQSLDIYMTSPPCQSFSLAGKRKGENSINGILFFNSHEFIKKNKPRYFIFENVKGLLSDNNGKTFAKWCDYLGGKSVNGNTLIFPHEESVPYHIYTKVLNAKHYGVPQNRERIFIVGIRDDKDNTFRWPKPIPLVKRLKDVLENNVDEKYYLSDKLINLFVNNTAKNKTKGNGFAFKPKSIYNDDKLIANTITTRSGSRIDDNYIKIKTNPKKANEIANQEILIGAIRGRNPENPKSRIIGLPTEQRLEINKTGTSNALTTVQKDNVVVYGNLKGGKWDKTHEQSGRVYDISGVAATVNTMGGGNQEPKIYQDYKIRKLTPRECFRLMDFSETFKMVCSNSQLYKQAGNSIVVNVLAEILKKLNI